MHLPSQDQSLVVIIKRLAVSTFVVMGDPDVIEQIRLIMTVTGRPSQGEGLAIESQSLGILTQVIVSLPYFLQSFRLSMKVPQVSLNRERFRESGQCLLIVSQF